MSSDNVLEKMQAKQSGIQRWLSIIDAFLVAKEWGVRDLASAVGSSPSTVHRVLHEMTRIGMLTEIPGAMKRWTIGPELLHLVAGLSTRAEMLAVGRTHMQRLAEATDETAYLSLYSPTRHQFFVAVIIHGQHPYRYFWSERLQSWADLHVGSDGRVILAFLPEQERNAIVDALSTPILSLHPMSKASFLEELETIRSRWIAISSGERYAGVLGASAPLLDSHRYPIGSVTVSWPETRDHLGLAEDYALMAANCAEAMRYALAEVPTGLRTTDTITARWVGVMDE